MRQKKKKCLINSEMGLAYANILINNSEMLEIL